jgi:beta-glucosidase
MKAGPHGEASSMTKHSWPKDFVWGVSTSAYQIEGAAKEDGRGPSIWDIHASIPSRTAKGETGDVACDHYHRWPEDVALMKGIGVDAYRFSVSWSRVLPRGRGAVNAKGIDFYDRVIDAVCEAGITPWLCLYHWDLPQGLDDLGGWTNRDVAGWFADYTLLLARRFGDRVKHWATFNEPNVATIFGYAMNWNAPGVVDRAAYFRAAHHLNLSHGAAVDVIRDWVKGSSVGVVHNRQVVYPEKDTDDDRRAAQLLDAHWNLIFPDPQYLGTYPDILVRDVEPFMQAGDLARICRPLDWFGVNHYGPIYARADANTQLDFAWGNGPQENPHPELGWPIHPDEFRKELLRVQERYKLPVYVTENGCGSDKETIGDDGQVNDRPRISFLTEYTDAMAQAISEGCDVRGYFIWSLLDNFEWGSGYGNRFGLIYVDYQTLKRIPKASSRWYADLIRTAKA